MPLQIIRNIQAARANLKQNPEAFRTKAEIRTGKHISLKERSAADCLGRLLSCRLLSVVGINTTLSDSFRT